MNCSTFVNNTIDSQSLDQESIGKFYRKPPLLSMALTRAPSGLVSIASGVHGVKQPDVVGAYLGSLYWER